MSAEASEVVSIPRAELDAMKAELKRLRREVGRGVARARVETFLIPVHRVTPLDPHVEEANRLKHG